MSVILKIGASGYVTIDGANYERGFLGSKYETIGGVDTLAIFVDAQNGPKWLYYPNPYTAYLDGDNANAPFASMAALHAWMDANFEAAGGGGGTVTSITAGTGLSGGTITGSGTIALNGVLPAISSVNSIPAVGNGIPVIVAQYKQNGVTSNTTTINYTPTTSGSIFRISWGAYLNNRGVNSITLNFKDQNGNARAIPLSGYADATPLIIETTFNAGGTFITGNSAEFTVNTGTNITVDVVFQNSPNVDLWFTLTRLF